MGSKTTTTRQEPIGRVGQRRQVVIPQHICESLQLKEGDFVAFAACAGGVLIKPKRMVDPDDVLTREESALVKKAEREMRQGKYVTLARLEHELAHNRSPRSRKTA
jgi:AbrB family looped-hinge helix DNA binding protein